MVRPQHYGSTRSGLLEWLLQRLTAVYSAGYAVYFIVYAWLTPLPDRAAWIEFLQPPLMQIGLITFWLATLVHAWIGLRSVALDYLHPVTLRMTTLAVIALGLWVLGLWGILLLVAGVNS